MSKRTFDDDDGRSYADMGGVERRNIFLPRLSHKNEVRLEQSKPEKSAEGYEFTKNETRSIINGAVAAGLLIALYFIVGLGLFLALFLWLAS